MRIKKRFLVLAFLFIQIFIICSSFYSDIPKMPKIHTVMGQNGTDSSATPYMAVTSITQNPDRIVPGDTFSETFSLTNAGDGEAKMVQLSISVSYPFAVMETSSNILIGDFQPKEGRYMPIKFSVDEDAQVGVYSIPFTIQYKDVNGTGYVQSGTFGTQISGNPQIQIERIRLDPSSLSLGQEGLMTIRLTNVGTDVATDIKIRIFGGNDIVASSMASIAKIDSKQSESTIFPINIDSKLEPAIYLLNITATYRDSLNNTYYSSRLYEFKVGAVAPFIPSFYITITIGAAIVALVGYFLYVWKPRNLPESTSPQKN